MDFKRLKEIMEAEGSPCRLHDPVELEESFETFLLTREALGWDLTFYLPGTIRIGNLRGRYPAISITGSECKLMCEHCKAKLLDPMWKVSTPQGLMETLLEIARKGFYGALLTGGANEKGMLPWESFLEAIYVSYQRTQLFLSAHTGFLTIDQAKGLYSSGVRQGLLDVMGSSELARSVYKLDSLAPVLRALEAIKASGMELVPHIVSGLDFGRIESEFEAAKILSEFQPDAIVIVVITPLRGTPMAHIKPPSPLEVARLIRSVRRLFPETPISLGCERKRGRYSLELEYLAILNGVNRIAVWSEESISFARALGLKLRFQYTCCSLPPNPHLATDPQFL